MNMKRELKFRAWDTATGVFLDQSKWNIRMDDGNVQLNGNAGISTGIILMQYTGLKDKNGVEIYEGDIIEFDREEWRGYDNIHVVTWDNEEGGWNWGGGSTSDMCYRTIIGNIHQHPHLLTQK